MEGADKGRVIAHLLELELREVFFKVSQAGRLRVLKECSKNVHAGLQGYWAVERGERPLASDLSTIPVRYDPYLFSSFVRADNLEPIHRASRAWLKDGRVQVLRH